MQRYRSIVRSLALASGGALLVSACGTGSGASNDGETVTLTFSSHNPEDAATMRPIQKWMELVEEATDGRVEFEGHYSESLLPAAEALPGTADGRVDMSWVGAVYFPSELPLAGMGALPFQTRNPEAQARALTELVEENEAFAEEWERQQVHPLFFTPLGTQVMGFTEPVEDVADLSGRSVRAVGYTAQVLQGVDATPVGLSATEVFESLDRGVIDGFSEFPMDVAVPSFSLHEVAPHFVEFGGGTYVASALVINQDVWNDLDADIQDAMNDAYDEFLTFALEEMTKDEDEACTELLSAGGSVTILDDAEVEQWRAEVEQGLTDTWLEGAEKAGVDRDAAQDALDTYQGLLSEAEKDSEREPGIVRCAAQAE